MGKKRSKNLAPYTKLFHSTGRGRSVIWENVLILQDITAIPANTAVFKKLFIIIIN
jgi:hypothetical protein